MITFAFPWMLAGLAAAAIPILLHLFARRDPPTVVFPAVRYLDQTARRHQRRLSLQHWLLLLLRTLLILLLVLVAAGPSRAAGRGPGTHAPSALVLIADNSLSSAAVSGGDAVWGSIREAARRVLARATPSDAVTLLTAGAPRAGGPRPRSADSSTASRPPPIGSISPGRSPPRRTCSGRPRSRGRSWC